MKTDFSEQVEKLRKEITTAIKAVLEEYGKTEMEFPDTVDAVYVIWFDHDGDPYECLVRRIQFFGKDLHLVVEDKHSHDLYEIDGPFELGVKWISSEVQLSFTVECTWKSRHWAPLNLIVSFGVPSLPEVFITSPLFRMRELNIHSSNSFEGNPAMLTCICPPVVFPAACPHGVIGFRKSYS